MLPGQAYASKRPTGPVAALRDDTSAMDRTVPPAATWTAPNPDAPCPGAVDGEACTEVPRLRCARAGGTW
jgi:hypothetical protein